MERDTLKRMRGRRTSGALFILTALLGGACTGSEPPDQGSQVGQSASGSGGTSGQTATGGGAAGSAGASGAGTGGAEPGLPDFHDLSSLPSGCDVLKDAEGSDTASDLIGVWDASIDGELVVIEVKPTGLSLQWNDEAVVAQETDSGYLGTYSKTSNRTSKDTVVVSTGAFSVNLGIIPWEIGGDWTFSSQDYDGQVTIEPTLLSMQWSETSPTSYVTLARMTSGESVLGEFAGSWRLMADNTECALEVAGNRGTADCGDDGRMTVVVGDGVISGCMTSGLEFSAFRRTP